MKHALRLFPALGLALAASPCLANVCFVVGTESGAAVRVTCDGVTSYPEPAGDDVLEKVNLEVHALELSGYKLLGCQLVGGNTGNVFFCTLSR